MKNNLAVQKKAAGEKQTDFYRKIERAGGFSNYVKNFADFKRAFVSDQVVRCIDEGMGEGGIRSAGSGIYYVITEGLEKGLDGKEALKVGINKAVTVFKKGKTQGLTSHEECGAAALVLKAMPEEIKEQFEHNPDKFGQYFGQEVAKRLDKRFTYIPLSKMGRLSHLHVARFSYFDEIGCFNLCLVADLPLGFTISANLDQKQAFREIDLSIQIALGDNGFPELITKEEPFTVVAIGKERGSGSLGELQRIAEKYQGRVRVVGA